MFAITASLQAYLERGTDALAKRGTPPATSERQLGVQGLHVGRQTWSFNCAIWASHKSGNGVDVDLKEAVRLQSH